jgi:hypothetical protein
MFCPFPTSPDGIFVVESQLFPVCPGRRSGVLEAMVSDPASKFTAPFGRAPEDSLRRSIEPDCLLSVRRFPSEELADHQIPIQVPSRRVEQLAEPLM